MKHSYILLACFLLLLLNAQSQVRWVNVDSEFGPLPASVHVYKTIDSLDGKPNIAYYLEADLKDKRLEFTTDTSLGRRLTPAKFYEKNEHPLVVMNTTFFSFATNQNLNVVINKGRMVSYNIHSITGRGKDTFTYRHPMGSAIGISRKRKADIAWLLTDSSEKYAYASQVPRSAQKDSSISIDFAKSKQGLKKWRMQTAVGGGPVLLQNGEVKVSNNEELKFAGKAIDDKHPRTAIGYTNNGKLILMVVQGRFPGTAEGASLTQLAQLFKNLNCVEAMNLDGGGSSCMLVNGKQTIKVSDSGGERPVPAVFIISDNR